MNPLQCLVIVGGGTSGWMTAAAISHFSSGKGLRVILVESDRIGTVGVGEATIPHIRYFNQRLGIAEDEFMRATNATYKLGIEFSNWGEVGNRYMHPFGEFGFALQGIGFHHWWLRLQQAGIYDSFFDYSLPVIAANLGRFAYPQPDHPLFSSYSYAFHLDATRYASFLRSYSEKKGVQRVEGQVCNVVQDPTTGDIQSLLLEDGKVVEGDFFVDCSGFQALLIEKTLQAGFESWKDTLPCDRAVAIPTEETTHPAPFTQSIAQSAGWQWRIPLQNRTGNGHVFASSFLSEDHATASLLNNLKGVPLDDPRILHFEAGRRRSCWVKNCVAIGLSSGFLEPLESTSIYLVQVAIMKLIELFPAKGGNVHRRAEFNRVLHNEYATIKDFLILHYHANTRTDSEFWRYCRHMPVPDSLLEKEQMFRAAGITPEYEHGLFMQPSWQAVFIGQGVVPERAHALTASKSSKEIAVYLQSLKTELNSAAHRLPSHWQAINEYCKLGAAPQWPKAAMSLYGTRHE